MSMSWGLLAIAVALVAVLLFVDACAALMDGLMDDDDES
jgi:hypothetical protein